MTPTTGWLPTPVEELFGPDATAEESYGVLTVDVPPSSWPAALEVARTTLSCTYFDWLSAVDEPGTGFRVCAHVVALAPARRLLLRTTVPHADPELPSAVGVYAGARWHERETHEMFGVRFTGHPGLDHLLLPETFEGHPLRKDFVLAARVAKAWPGAKEPGESDHGGPKRRQMLPPGVPDPNEWGPLKGQLPPAPARPARTAGTRPPATAGDRPVRRARTAAGGSASPPAEPPTTTDTTETPTTTGAAGQAPGTATAGQTPATGETGPTPSEPRSATTPRRSRTATGGSASQRAEGGEQPSTPARRSRTASAGSASQRAAGAAETAAEQVSAEENSGEQASPEQSSVEETAPAPERSAAPRGPRRARTASGGSASQRAQEAAPSTEPAAPPRPARGADAPWHHARPAFDEPEPAGRRATPTEPPGPTVARPGAEEGPVSDDAAPEEPDTAAPGSDASAAGSPPAPETPGTEKRAPEKAASDHAGPDHAGPDHGDSDHADSDHGDSDHGDSDHAGPDQPPRDDRPGGSQ
ncbi:NADH-quinone oxidoreductase subunit C [Streptomyces sp. NPDC006655]|uniref:NADH-quinone oxidoreductase subunit C n=1 Tax=Streptomyces sp. NPDC006655 TaxID=3156898 RepID=UPI003454015B